MSAGMSRTAQSTRPQVRLGEAGLRVNVTETASTMAGVHKLKRAYLFNTGCIRRALDATRIYQYLTRNGWSFTNNISAAQLVVVSTCGAVAKTEDLSLIALRHVCRKMSADATLVVTGCLPTIKPEVISSLPLARPAFCVPTRELHRLDDILQPAITLNDIPDANLVSNEIGLLDYVLAFRLFRHSIFLGIYKKMSTSHGFLKGLLASSRMHNAVKRMLGLPAQGKIVPYYNLRIAEGCAFKCAYCCIRFATKRVTSKPIEHIMEEFRAGVSAGHRVFQLVCEDVGCYGIDRGTTFPELLRNLLSVEGGYRLVLLDFGAFWLVKYYHELRPLLENHPDKFQELYVSIQSGSNKILVAMRRPEKIEDVIAALKDIKDRMPHLALRTTVIVGFPGETDADFEETIKALQQVDFTAVEINKYEDRPGTESSRMDNKITAEVIGRRVEELARRVPAARGSRRA